MRSHYNKKYFLWQKKAGIYTGTQDTWKFEPYIKKTDTVLDFGCGGGYLLENLKCYKKYGIEINPYAAAEARRRNITVFNQLRDLPKSTKFDVILSNHTLEHLENPALTLTEMKKYLKKRGKLICIVPIDNWKKGRKYDRRDINEHLYTWTPLLFGNLFSHLSYKVKYCTSIYYHWLPLSGYYYRLMPKMLYRLLCKLWAWIIGVREIKLVASL